MSLTVETSSYFTGLLEQKSSSGIGEEDRQLVNYDPWLYSVYPDRLLNIDRDLQTFIAEVLMLSTSRFAKVDDEKGFVHDNGLAYTSFFDRSIEYYRSDQSLVDRFIAEKLGYERAHKMIQYFWERYQILAPFVIASPPGEVYDKTSLTFVGIPIGKNENGFDYRLYSIPTNSISATKHWEVVSSVSSVQESLEALGILIESPTTPNEIVGIPVAMVLGNVANSLDKLASGIGFPNWEAIQHDTEIAALLEKSGDKTSKRRQLFVSHFGNLIREMVVNGEGRIEFEALRETIRQTMSAESGAFFENEQYFDLDDIRVYLEQLFVGNGGSVKYASNYWEREQDKRRVVVTDWYGYGDYVGSADSSYEEMRQLAIMVSSNMRGWIGGNDKALASYMGTGCGVGERNRQNNVLSGNRFDYFENQSELMTYNSYNIGSYENLPALDNGGAGWKNGKPEGTVKSQECVHCPLCGRDGVTAFFTSTRIYCSECKQSVELSTAG